MEAPSLTRRDDRIQRISTRKKSRAKNGYYAEPWVEDKEAIGQKLVEQRVHVLGREWILRMGRLTTDAKKSAVYPNLDDPPEKHLSMYAPKDPSHLYSG
jgi:hypothetical protein